MVKEDKERLWKALLALALNAGVDRPDKDGARLYYSALKQFTIEEIEAAATKVLLSWRYNRMPPIVEIIEAIPGRESQAQIENKPHAEADKILEHLRLHGSGKWPPLDDPITKHLMTTRWHYPRWASRITESETKWWIKEFVEAYKSYKASGDIPRREEIEAPDPVLRLIENIGKRT